jgi:hypothetical protein
MWCKNIKYSTKCFATIFNIQLLYLRLNKRNLENGFKQFILRGMDGWMDVLHSRRHGPVFTSAPSLFPSLPSLLPSFLPALVCCVGRMA